MRILKYIETYDDDRLVQRLNKKSKSSDFDIAKILSKLMIMSRRTSERIANANLFTTDNNNVLPVETVRNFQNLEEKNLTENSPDQGPGMGKGRERERGRGRRRKRERERERERERA